jgi:hypothetical protein
MARLNATANWLGKTEAFLEKKEPAPDEKEVVAEPQEVPNGATDELMIGATEDRSRDRRLAVGCRGQLKTRTKRDSGFRQEYAATVGRPTRRTVPAMSKGKLLRGHGKKCRSGIGGPSKASPSEKMRRTRPECNNSIRDRGARPLIFKKERIFKKVIRQSLGMEIARLLVKSSIGLREPGDGILWKCRLPPKRKR